MIRAIWRVIFSCFETLLAIVVHDIYGEEIKENLIKREWDIFIID